MVKSVQSVKNVWDLKNEILLFLNIKGISSDFVIKMESGEWIYEMMFATDIFKKLIELNVRLQKKGLYVETDQKIKNTCQKSQAKPAHQMLSRGRQL